MNASRVRRVALPLSIVISIFGLSGCGSDSGSENIHLGRGSLAEVFGDSDLVSVHAAPLGVDRILVTGLGEGSARRAVCDIDGACRRLGPDDLAAPQPTVRLALASTPDGERVLEVQAHCDVSDLEVCEPNSRRLSVQAITADGEDVDETASISPAVFERLDPLELAGMSAHAYGNNDLVLVFSGPASVPGPPTSSTVVWLDAQGRVHGEQDLDGSVADIAVGPDGTVLALAFTAEPSFGGAPAGDDIVEPAAGRQRYDAFELRPSGNIERINLGAEVSQPLVPIDGSLFSIDDAAGRVVEVESGDIVGELAPPSSRSEDRLGGVTSCTGSRDSAVALEVAYDEGDNVGTVWAGWSDDGRWRSEEVTVSGVVSAVAACVIDGRPVLFSTSFPEPGLERDDPAAVEVRPLGGG